MYQNLIISENLIKESKDSFSIEEITSFLLNSEKELKAKGYPDISWDYSTGEHDGYKYRDSYQVWVTGSRLGTKDEILVKNQEIKAKKIEDIKKRILGIKEGITHTEGKVANLKALSIRLKSEINLKESRIKDVENNEKGITRNEKELIEKKVKLNTESPLLNLDDESLLNEWLKLYPHESLYLYRE